MAGEYWFTPEQLAEMARPTMDSALEALEAENYEKVAALEKPARVVYVLTDLARSAWEAGRPAEGLDKVEKIKSQKKGRMVTFVLRLTPQEIEEIRNEARVIQERQNSRGSAGPRGSGPPSGSPLANRAYAASV